MNRGKPLIQVMTMAGLLLANSTVFAATKVCLPEGWGVPGRDGAPKWAAWDATSKPVNEDLFDPRWNGASGHAFGLGSATPEAQFRGVYANEGGQTYLYLSWQMNVSDINDAQGRQIYLGFRPPSADGHDARMIRLRFPKTVGAADTGYHTTGFTKCINTDTTCFGPSTARVPFYMSYDWAAPNNCASTATEFAQNLSAAAADKIEWLENSARFWVLPGNKYAVQIRIPINATASQPFNKAIVEGTKIWYEVPLDQFGTTARHAFPRGSEGVERLVDNEFGESLCKNTADFQNSFATVVKVDYGTTDTECNAVSLAYDDVGFVHDAPGGTDFSMVPLTNVIRGRAAPGSSVRVVNTLVARPFNNGTVPINAGEIKARFRIANWGAQPADFITYNPLGWNELPIGPDGPDGEPTRSSHDIGGTAAAIGQKSVIKVDWPLTERQRCQYGLDTGAACEPPTMSPEQDQIYTGWDQCILVELSGTGNFEFSNTSLYKNMMFGEMSVFEKPAVIDTAGLPDRPGKKWNDIYVSVVPRNLPESLPEGYQGIDLIADNAARALEQLLSAYGHEDPWENDRESIRGDGPQVLAMAINDDVEFPSVIPGDDSGVANWVMRRPFGRELDALLPEAGELPYEIWSLPGELRETVFALARIANIPRGGGQNAREEGGDGYGGNGRLTAELLTRELSEVLPAPAIDALLPSLDFYVYYDTGEKLRDGNTKVRQLGALSSFSWHGFHDGEVKKLIYILDGASERISENFYRIRIKKGQQAALNIRVQAVEPGEDEICPDDDFGEGGCKRFGFLYAGLGLVFAVGFRRRRRQQK